MATPNLPTTPANGTERRRFPRYNVALDVAFGAVPAEPRPSPAQLAKTITVNLSAGGLCLYSDVLYPIGSQVFCHLTLPHRQAPIEVTGTVAWFQRIDREAHGYKLGIEFGALRPQDAAALQALLDQPLQTQPTHARTLLLVDDDDELRLALKLRFEAAGFRVLTAADGLEALRKGREDHPQLIILDLMLPQLNGYEVCRLLKFDQKFCHIPIVLVTARSRQEDMEMGRSVGADAYMTKPFHGKDLIAKVEELLGARAG